LIAAGIIFIRKRNTEAHKKCMIAALFVSAAFLTSYVTYHAFAGHVVFKRSGWVSYVYKFVLFTHIPLAGVIAVIVPITAYFGYRNRLVSHVAIARWTFPIWMYVSVTGVVVY